MNKTVNNHQLLNVQELNKVNRENMEVRKDRVLKYLDEYISRTKTRRIHSNNYITNTHTYQFIHPMPGKRRQPSDKEKVNGGVYLKFDTEDYGVFQREVEGGTLYEYMQNQLTDTTDGVNKPLDRNKVKRVVLTAMYASDAMTGDRHESYLYANKQRFKELFPSVYELFRIIKEEKHSTLALLLQNVESIIFLKRVAKRIAKEHPTIPIITIHDSICTTVGNEHFVEKIMMEEIEKATGVKPNLKVEAWASE
ncbi:hypothetical protein GCM10023189_31560 [Nibrella saemangeumensis]|uniref:DNA-directed DNA polymerase family A palm domain-containing protein n=2 Tax=Nibrella saemangeumensis TaxID=1084526 RepID=A0ABP8MZP8_9BACT